VTGYTFGQILRLLPPPDRQQLATRFGVAADPDALAEALVEQTAERIQLLSPTARDLLRRLWLAGGQAAMDLLFRTEPALHGAVGELARDALAVELRVDYYHHVLALPLEVQQAAFEPLIAPVLTRIATGKRPEATTVPAAPPWVTDLFRLLSALRWYAGPLTQQGELYKRVRTAIERTFWPDPTRSPEERDRLLLGFAEWAGLVNVNRLTRQIEVTTLAEEFWQGSPRARWERWFEYFVREALGRIPFGQVAWDLLTGSPGGQALAADGMVELIASSGFVTPMRARHAVQATAQAGAEMGFVIRSGRDVGLSATGLAWLDGRVADVEPSRAVVQPTGEVIVPVETPLDVVWQAESALTLAKADVVWTYRLDHEAVDRALSQGLTADDVLARLQALSRTPLPDNVGSEIQDMWRKVGRVRVLDTTVIWTESAQLARTLGDHLKDLVRERLGDSVLVLGPVDGDAAIKRLQKLGYLVRSRPERPGEWTTRLAEPVSVDYRYRPQVQASLPAPAVPQSARDPGGIGDALVAALRRHQTVRVAYRPAGRSEPVHATIYPVAVHSGILFGVLQDDTRQSFQVPLGQIVEVWRLA
jgi:hypothetical protein